MVMLLIDYYRLSGYEAIGRTHKIWQFITLKFKVQSRGGVIRGIQDSN